MEDPINYHYYGDRIRALFFLTGLLMVVTLPVFSSLIQIPVTASLVAILALAILGGVLNPSQKWTIITDTIVSILGFAGFEYYAVDTYLHVLPNSNIHIYFYWLNQIFALLFFLAVYLSTKTLRGKILEENKK